MVVFKTLPVTRFVSSQSAVEQAIRVPLGARWKGCNIDDEYQPPKSGLLTKQLESTGVFDEAFRQPNLLNIGYRELDV